MRGQSRACASFLSFGLGLILAVALVYLLDGRLFQSWFDPLIIMIAIPGAFVGIAWMLTVTDTTLNVESFMGAIMAIGIAVSNSIPARQLRERYPRRERGATPLEAALEAGKTRLRPVLMTALAMGIGMFPMALALGEAASRTRRSVARSSAAC